MAARAVACMLVVGIATAALGRTPSFRGLGDLPGGSFASMPSAVSADGLTVVGNSDSGVGVSEVFRWTAETGMQGLGDLPGGKSGSFAYGVSADGTVVVGQAESALGEEAFRWTAATGMQGLGGFENPEELTSEARAVSADGSVVAGHSVMGYHREAFRWTAEDGMQQLDDLGGGNPGSWAYGISADASVIVGVTTTSATGRQKAFRWTAEGGMQNLGDLLGGHSDSTAKAVSADGRVVVGNSLGPSGQEAFRWTAQGGMQGLGDLPGGSFGSYAEAVSADGSVIVGSSHIDYTTIGDAFIWDMGHGMRPLKEVLETECGLDLGQWRLKETYGISADGLTIVGWGWNPSDKTEAWIATLPEPATLSLLAAGLGALLVRKRRALAGA